MVIPYDLEMIRLYLKNHGYNATEIDTMQTEKLFDLYRECSLKGIYEFQAVLNHNGNFFIKNIKNHDMESQFKSKILKIQKSFSKIYDLIDEYIDEYDYEEFLEILTTHLDTIPPNKLKRILKVKYRQIQQVWLEKLEERLKVLPIEERISLMKYYEKHQDDIKKLRQIYEDSKDPAYIEKLRKISEVKLDLIKVFMPSLMEENYKAYYDETPQKLELVERVLGLSSSYSKKYLKELTIPRLKSLENEIIEQNKRDSHDKKLFHKYSKALLESMNSMDDDEFSKVCLDAIAELNTEQLQRVLSFLTTKNKLFLNKFNATVRHYQGITKTKFIS